jgi:Ser/Thr protein kinase RdoA (MazF antagonist)
LAVETLAILHGEYKAHGLAGEWELPDWPALTLPEVDALLRRYPHAGGALRIISVSPRPFSAASVVETRHGTVFVKRHARSVRDRAGLLEEHRFLAHLSAEFPDLVQGVLADRDGETAICQGEWTYEVHPVARGVDVYEDALSWTPFRSRGHAYAAGHALAKLHQAAESYDAPAREFGQLISSYSMFSGNDPESAMESYLEKRPDLREYAEQRNWRASMHDLLIPLYRKLEPWLGYLRPLWTHNDFHASNLTWSGAEPTAEVTGIIDFGLSDLTNAVYDLATAMERNIVEWLRIEDLQANIVHLDHLDALLDGYEELAPMNHEQARALASMLPIVHCEFALSETDYFLSILKSPEKAYLAYEGYFLGHAQWFLGEQGQRLLHRLEERSGRSKRR